MSIQDRDTASEPVDVDVELSLARGNGDAPAVAAAVGKETDRPDAVADEIVLRGEQLDVDFRRKVVLGRITVDLESLACDVDDQERLAALGKRFATREPQPRRELTRACA